MAEIVYQRSRSPNEELKAIRSEQQALIESEIGKAGEVAGCLKAQKTLAIAEPRRQIPVKSYGTDTSFTRGVKTFGGVSEAH